jgi:hypothetical protein
MIIEMEQKAKANIHQRFLKVFSIVAAELGFLKEMVVPVVAVIQGNRELMD